MEESFKPLRKLLESLREYKKPSILTPVFVVVEVIVDVLIPFVMAKLIDQGIDEGSIPVIVHYGIILLIFAFVSLFTGWLAGKFAAKASCGFAKNLRKDMYEKVQTFSFANIDRFSTAGIVTRLTTDVTNVQNAYQMVIRTLVRSPLLLIFSLVVCFRINARLALIFVVVIPILLFVLILIIRLVNPYFKRVFKTYDTLNEVVQENLHGVRVVKSYVREDFENEKFAKVSQLIFKDFSSAEKIIAFNMPAMNAAVYTSIILVAWFGARLIVNTGSVALTTGQLMSIFTYSMSMLMGLMMISMVFVMVIMAVASMRRIGRILIEESDIQSKENAVAEVKDGSIVFENVNFAYSEEAEKNVLSGISLEIQSGETVGIIGGTGSSKSSLVQLIPRLYDVSSGTLRVGGVDVRDYDLQVLRDQVAMVLQKNVLFSGTIKENLRWGKEDATDEEMLHACRLAQADEFIQQMPLKYETYIERGGANVSGGQKQRLCIARALLKKPKILILDDSTSAVDTKTDALIRQAFREEIPDTTKIIIAQRISSVEDADKIIVLDDGRISAVGSHAELLKTSDIYREVYESQQKGGAEDEQ